MASTRKSVNSKINSTKETVGKTVNKVLSQAKESLKMLETIEKETRAKVQSFVKIPNDEKVKMTNDAILSSLRKLGVATQDEVSAMRAKITSLENEVAQIKSRQNTAN